MSPQNFEATRVQQCTDVQFQAVVTGKPIPEVSWTKKGNNLPNSDKYQHTYDPKSGHITLLIVDIGPGDEGQYRQDSPKIKLNKSVLSPLTKNYVSTACCKGKRYYKNKFTTKSCLTSVVEHWIIQSIQIHIRP